jgi:hypothetical protein
VACRRDIGIEQCKNNFNKPPEYYAKTSRAEKFYLFVINTKDNLRKQNDYRDNNPIHATKVISCSDSPIDKKRPITRESNNSSYQRIPLGGN